MAMTICVSISEETHRLAKEKNISWARAIERGIKELAFQELSEDNKVSYQKTKTAELEELKRNLYQANKKIKELSEKKEFKVGDVGRW